MKYTDKEIGKTYISFDEVTIDEEKLDRIEKEVIRFIVSELPEEARIYEIVGYILERAKKDKLNKIKVS